MGAALVTDPFSTGQTTIFPHLDPDLFREVAQYFPARLAWNRSQEVDVPAVMRAVDAYRVSLGLSWTQVSEDTGVPTASLSRVSLGHGKPALENFIRLLLWMGITDFARFLISK